MKQWKMLADGLTKEQLLIYLLPLEPKNDLRVVWVANEVTYMIPFEMLSDVNTEVLEAANDFAIWIMT